MRKIAIALGLVAAFLLVMNGCSSPTKKDDKDLAGPTFTVDSMFEGTRVLHSDDSVTTDSIFMKGHVRDTSGIRTITVSIAQIKSMNITIHGDSTWDAVVFLRSGANAVSFEAEDQAGNTAGLSKNLYYVTEYFPIDTNSYWKFSGSAVYDTVLVKVNGYGPFAGTLRYFVLGFYNPIAANPDTVLYTFNHAGAFVTDSAMDATTLDSKDSLFLNQYTPQMTAYNGKSVRYVGDTVITSTTYRNCVLVGLEAGKSFAGITSFLLCPDQGIVGIQANGKGYPLTSHR